ncbi:hypothetical protein COOONC_18116 [Cooperia oncophora]
MFPLYYYHGLVRDELYFNFSSTCCGNNIETCNIVTIFNDPLCSSIALEVMSL